MLRAALISLTSLLQAQAPASLPAEAPLALIHATVWTSPEAPPLADATVLVRDGRIQAVGREVKAPSGAWVVDCQGRPLLAGFWNGSLATAINATMTCVNATSAATAGLSRWIRARPPGYRPQP